MQLHAAADLTGVLVEGRLEVVRAKADAGQVEAVQLLAQLERIEPRRAEELERMRGAAPLAEVRPFDQAHAGIDRGGVDRRHVRRRDDPGQSRVAPPHRAPPAAHRHDVQVAVELEDFVEVAGQLAGGHAVPRRQREHADEAGELLLADVALQVHAVDRIRPIEHDDLHAGRRRLPHAERHGVDEGVVAGADVLQVDD